MALKDDQKEKENKRHTMSHPPDHIPELDSPRQSRSPIKKDKKERVSRISIFIFYTFNHFLSNTIVEFHREIPLQKLNSQQINNNIVFFGEWEFFIFIFRFFFFFFVSYVLLFLSQRKCSN